MTNENILDILKMRMAVYKAGINAGMWKDIDQSGALDMMKYIFPKSGNLAYYNLILEFLRKEHNMLTGGVYYLFKLPAQIEKEISDYLKREEINLASMVNSPEEYLISKDTIPTEHSFDIVNIGGFAIQELNNLLSLCASHYRYSFENHIQSYPYFE